MRRSSSVVNRPMTDDQRLTTMKASSSIGRAPVSKTGGWGFDSLLACQPSLAGSSGPRASVGKPSEGCQPKRNERGGTSGGTVRANVADEPGRFETVKEA